MRKSILLVFLISLLITSCGPAPDSVSQKTTPERTPALVPTSTSALTSTATATAGLQTMPSATLPPTSTETPTPALTPSPTVTNTPIPTAAPTERPQATLEKVTTLYSGPGNQGYNVVAKLEVGETVWPLGTFGDFVQVEALADKAPQIGFVLKSDLGTFPPGIPELESSQVPWQPMDILDSFFDATATLRGTTITVNNTNYDGYYDFHGRPVTLETGFKISLQLQTSDRQWGSLKLQDQPNSEQVWWQGIRRLDIATDGRYLRLEIHDGRSEAGETIYLSGSGTQTVTVTFLDPNGKSIAITNSEGQQIALVDVSKIKWLDLSDGLFPENRIYIGCVTSPKSILTIGSLSMEVLPTGKWMAASQSETPSGLRQFARQKGITMGTDFSWWWRGDARYWNIMTKDYDVAILSEFSSQDFWRGRGDYNFERMDNIVNWTLRSGWQVRASHLVWGAIESKAVPNWLLKGQYSREEYIQILKEHIKTVVGHYKGRVAEWSIANEAIGRSFCDSGCDFWNDKIGPEYIEIAFRAAREADPNAILIFNDDNNQSPQDAATQRNIDKMYATVKDLKSRGVPIDIVGMQMHLFLPWNSQVRPKKEDVIKTMQRFAELGVDIYVTEFDVNLHERQGSQKERWDFEAELYRDMVAACLESGVCKSFATWGVSDSTSWITCTEDWCVKLPDADPLMYDKEFRPKPAYKAVYDVLAGGQ